MKKLLLIGIPVVLALAGVLFFTHSAQSFGFGGASQHHAGMMKDFILYRIDRMAKELDLTPDQQARLDTLKRNFESTFDERMQNREKIHDQLKAELRKDDPDISKLTPIIDQQIDTAAQTAHEMVGQVSEFLNTLTPEQKRILSDHVLEHMQEHEAD